MNTYVYSEMESKIFIFQSVILLIMLLVNCSLGAKILAFMATASRSHFIVEEPVLRELAKRGHEVTVVTSFKQSGEPLTNYRYIEIPDFLNDSTLSQFTSEVVQSTDERSSAFKVFTFFNRMVGYSANLLRHPKFLAIKNEQFDLLVIGWFLNEYALGLSGHFHCPSVVISPNVNFYPIRQFSGNPSSVSTIPSVFMAVNPKMTFLDRLFNFVAYIVECVMFEITFHFYTMPYYNEEFPPDKYPSYNEVLKNVSLVLVAQHFSGQKPEALLPNVIEIEGIHVKKEPSPLPKV